MSAPREVLDFWFGAPGAPEHGRARAEWFRKDAAFDAQVRARFGAALEQALAGGLADWCGEPEGTLALILVLDQFTRNAFRDTPRAFAGDARALALARGLVASGADRSLARFPRAFAYLPFEHAESLEAQQQSVVLYEALAAEYPDAAEELDYALRHRDIVARFGRFPHRNAILGRPSTAEEVTFLQQPGSRF